MLNRISLIIKSKYDEKLVVHSVIRFLCCQVGRRLINFGVAGQSQRIDFRFNFVAAFVEMLVVIN